MTKWKEIIDLIRPFICFHKVEWTHERPNKKLNTITKLGYCVKCNKIFHKVEKLDVKW